MALLDGKQTHIACYKKNRDRDVCRVFADGADLGLEMVRCGYAEYAFQFAHEQTEQERRNYADAERFAKSQQLGLWAETDPMPPWVCRALRRGGQRCR